VDSRELAWAAGFFDGEGWSGLSQEAGRRTGQPQARINQADPNGVPEVLRRFRSSVGFGRIGGPYEKDGRLISTDGRSRAAVMSKLCTICSCLGWAR